MMNLLLCQREDCSSRHMFRLSSSSDGLHTSRQMFMHAQYGSSYGGQATTTTNAPPYGQKPAVQQSSYTAAPQQQSQYKSAVPPRATGYSTPSFTAPTGPGRGTTGRPTGGASTQPSYGRPVVQPSVAARLPSQTHAGRGAQGFLSVRQWA